MGGEIGQSGVLEGGMMNVLIGYAHQPFWVGKAMLIGDSDQMLKPILLINTTRRLNIQPSPVKGIVLTGKDLKHTKDLTADRTQKMALGMVLDDSQDSRVLNCRVLVRERGEGE